MKSSLYPSQELRRRTLAWALKLKVNPRTVRVQVMRRKWGSCSSTGTITLATDLLDHESRFQDYVIVHELLHMRYATHGRMFKALMSAHVPGWQTMEALAASYDVVRLRQGCWLTPARPLPSVLKSRAAPLKN